MKLTSKDNSLYIDFEFKLRNLSLIIIESAHWCWKTHQTAGKKIVNIKSIIILTLFQYRYDEYKHINDMKISLKIKYISTKNSYTKLNRLILHYTTFILTCCSLAKNLLLNNRTRKVQEAKNNWIHSTKKIVFRSLITL